LAPRQFQQTLFLNSEQDLSIPIIEFENDEDALALLDHIGISRFG
jgi:hypothetical protein